MKNTGLSILLSTALVFVVSLSAHGQFRDQLDNADYSGPVVQEHRPEPGNWSNLFNMKMSHSYSMTFSSFGGQYRNINAYTNHMDFFFTDRLTGELDISLMHSPFGQGLGNNNNQLGAEVVIRNAELNYQISENSHISIQFQQYPYSPYTGFGGGPFNSYNRMGFDRY